MTSRFGPWWLPGAVATVLSVPLLGLTLLTLTLSFVFGALVQDDLNSRLPAGVEVFEPGPAFGIATAVAAFLLRFAGEYE